uniref:Methyltransferase-like protein 25 n=1 Tax=Cacopsylla melanoneura TaxID=428564 RepID=A0A8D8ZSV9_9HEMI
MVALSDVYSNSSVYFKEAVDFFDQFSWVFDFPNTDILVKDVLSQIPPEWVSVFSTLTDDEIQQYPVELFTKNTWPLDLQKFTNKCKDYQLSIEQYSSSASPIKLSGALQRGVGKKKMHEISILSSLINEKCAENNIKCLVDIGSGVGYLDEILVHNYNFNVIGLECDQSKIDGALTRIEKQNTKNNVEYKDKLKYICTYIRNISCQTNNALMKNTNNAVLENESVSGIVPSNIPENISAVVPNKTSEMKFETNKTSVRKGKFHGLLSDNVERNLKTDVHNEEVEHQTVCFSSVDANQNISQFGNSHTEFIETPANSTPSKTNSNSKPSKTNSRRRTLSSNYTSVDLSTSLHNSPYCFIGLHTCGDLSVSVIHHFFTLPLARQLIYIPCCYHKLKCLETAESVGNSGVNLTSSINQSEANFTSRINKSEDNLTSSISTSDVNVTSSVDNSGVYLTSSINQSEVDITSSIDNSGRSLTSSINKSGGNFTSSINTSEGNFTSSINNSGSNFTSSINQSGADFTPSNIQREISSSRHDKVSFANFPLSQSLRHVYHGNHFLSIPFLRLAAQETALTWCRYSREEKEEKALQLLFRGVLQLYAARENVKLVKKGRRPVKINQISAQHIPTLLNASINSFHLTCNKTGTRVEWKPTLLSQLWTDNVSKTPLVRTLLTLQNCLQGSAESLILLDRFKFLLESGGLTRVELLPIFNEQISPRRYCFVVSK